MRPRSIAGARSSTSSRAARASPANQWICAAKLSVDGRAGAVDVGERGGERPAHTLLLGAGVHVVEHLTNLGALPPSGARFTAAPPAIEGFGTFPVRAFAEL